MKQSHLLKFLNSRREARRSFSSDGARRSFSLYGARRSFSLLETALVLVILTGSLVVFTTMVTGQLATLKTSRERLTATLLAHEGNELVTAKRNYTFRQATPTQSQPWLQGIPIGVPFCIDLDGTILPEVPCTTQNSLVLVNGLYKHLGVGQPTLFKRTVTVTQPTPDTALVISEVSWGNLPLRVSTLLTKWHPFNQ